METKGYFKLGCKLFGVYCLLMGVPALGVAISTFFSQGDIPLEIQKAYFFATTVTRLIPVLYIGGGLYLLGGGENLYNYAYPDKETNNDINENNFKLAIKILGVYLIVSYAPSVLMNLSELITKTTAPSMFQMMSDHQFNFTNIISNTAGLFLGFYLLRSGKWFIKYGLKQS